MQALLFGLSIGLVVAASGCNITTPPQLEELLNVTVTIAPQKYFIERVGGDHVAVNVMVPPGASPATYEPTPVQMQALSTADVYVTYGAPLEQAWMDKFRAVNSHMRVVDSRRGVDLLVFPNGVTDPHIFLSPAAVGIQARNIAEALKELDPEHKEEYEANLQSFRNDLRSLDQRIRATLVDHAGAKFIVFHPAWAYFARDYDLEMVPIEVGGVEPSVQELRNIIELASREGIKVVFAQPEFSTRAAETIARSIGGEVILLDVLSEDWMNNMESVAETLARVFREQERQQP